MAEQEAEDIAARQRITTHMNDDHHDSIVRYLQNYCNLSSWTAYSGKMSEIDLNGMTLACGRQTHRIPFNPPMKSYRDARERIVEMDRECLQALGKSDITVKEFVPPTGLYAPNFIITAATFLAYSQRWWFVTGQMVERYLGSGFARFSYTIQPYLITAMIAIHGTEVIYFVSNHLRRHSVNPRTSLWWMWVFFAFTEGQFCFKRFNDLISRKREEKTKQKH